MRPSVPGVGVGNGVNCAGGAAAAGRLVLIMIMIKPIRPNPTREYWILFLGIIKIILEEPIVGLGGN
jgi:hypothetical protein